MKCPRCGKKLKDGNMYCDDCGFEINLVPDFDTEVEASMAESMREVIDEAISAHSQKEETVQQSKKKKSDIIFWFSGSGLAVVAFIVSAVIFFGMTVWNQTTFLQEIVAEYYLEDGNYLKAISYMEQNIQRAPNKASYRFKLCEIYMELGDEEKAIEIYKIIAGNPNYTFDEQLVAVEKIVSYYEKQKDYQTIADYLDTIQDENIQLAFYKYTSSTVSFSQPEGTYSSLITLKLDTDGLGTIHYTTDGTVPDENSPEFGSTIFLEPGENVISAVFINEFGVSSQVVTKNYFIESKKVSPPEVGAYSGTYNCPVKIDVSVAYGTKVYYTTDGTAPNAYSNVYAGNLYAPIGKSVFKFVAIDGRGEISEVITRDFQVTLDTQMTTEDARMILAQHLSAQNGKELDGSGHIIYDLNHLYVYEYLYPMSVEVGKDCYYFAEVSRDITTMEQHRTGKYFGVDIRSKEVYTFTP